MQDAAKEAGVMIDDQEIVSMANMRADSIVSEAQKEADELNGQSKRGSKRSTDRSFKVYTEYVRRSGVYVQYDH